MFNGAQAAPIPDPIRFEPIEARVLLSGGAIRGVTWEDINADGVIQTGEPLLAGWTVYLDTNHNNKLDAGETATTSAVDGSYIFSDLPAGNYLIGEVPKAGWKLTYPTILTGPSPAASLTGNADTPAIARAADLSQYTAVQLDSAKGWVVGLSGATTISSIVNKSGASDAAPISLLPSAYVLHFSSNVTGAQQASALTHVSGLSFFYPLIPTQQQSRFIPNDPLFPQQWYLHNTAPATQGLPGSDIDVLPAWDQYLGTGVTVGVVDDGVQYTHPDLAPNYDSIDSFDFDDNDPNPINNGNRDKHGTAVAGILAARGNNGQGVSGVAPQARFAALRLTDVTTTDQQEAGALSYHHNAIAVYSNSWGPDDDGVTLEGPGPLTLAAMKDSVTNGRNGKGNIYVWAAGNGLQFEDNTDYDGYANSHYVIAVTALDDFGKQAYYAEPGTPILVAAPGSGVSPGMYTTDLTGGGGYNTSFTNGDYYNNFGGTSASAPVVSGIVALMLQANPNLTWRDVKHILVDTAVKNDPTDPGWTQNGAGRWVNDKYGFGAVDAAAAVQTAKDWATVLPEASISTGTIPIDRTIPDDDTTGLTSSVYIDRAMKVETVEVVFDATHPARGDLRVVLTSPDGTQSLLAEPHNDPGNNYSQWTFTTNHDWDEISKGNWTLHVTDEEAQDVGVWNSWKLNIYGTPIVGEHYVTVADGLTVAGRNFGQRPLPGARVTSAGFPYQFGPQRLVFTFDKDISSSLSADDIEIRNDTTGQILPSSALRVDYNPGPRVATWTFPGLPHGVLPDGNYTARLKASQITIPGGGMLDGNGDGLGGDDFVLSFFQLKGDANRDRVVDTTDFKIFLENLGRNGASWDQGDFTYDGMVDFRDFQALELAFGNSLPAPVQAAAATAPVTSATAPTAAAKTTKPAKPVSPSRPAPAIPPPFSTQPIRRRDVDLLDKHQSILA
jgi:subtilisin-like proprotein convertase family protein